MKKRSVVAALILSMCLTAGSSMPVMADTAKVVTLGADLTQDQKNTMLQYFKTDSSQVQIITVTNADEREYLGNYISSAQIGTRTLSCAYVKPTSSGGIKVRTANLNYVTCNMIASALSTAGVTNCEAVAACPYEVSGTGALTGVMMAYETASGKKLDSKKKDLATREVVITGDASQKIGSNNAADIINQAKNQIINGNITTADDIYNYINNYSIEKNITMDSELLESIVSLLKEYQAQNETAIAEQSEEIEEMKTTLASIQQSIDSSKAQEAGEPTPTPIVTEAAADAAEEDITQDVDTSVLGTDVKETSTEDAGLAEETGVDLDEPVDSSESTVENAVEDSSEESTAAETNTTDSAESTPAMEGDTGIPVATGDGTWDNGSEAASDESEYVSTDGAVSTETSEASGGSEYYAEETDSAAAIPEATGDSYSEEASGSVSDSSEAAAEETTAASLDEAAQSKYNQAEQFCKGEYEGDAASLQAVMPSSEVLEFAGMLDATTGSSLTKKVEDAYLKVLQDAGVSYVADGTELYVSAELNMMNEELKTIFSVYGEPAADDILVNLSAEERTSLYNDTLKFFVYLYGENGTVETASESAEASESDSAGYYSEESSDEYYY